ncbi:hypothetical protein [Georgenia faecalis]|uniref:Uncharacterized protein n=1 Tax=Georgenia faecalis TaxID=2483799 RepID=A0ABV9D8X2_9MICO|nr:hypothetical protein [Georgenia faecalis]
MSDLAAARAAKTRLHAELRDDDDVVGIGLRRTADGYGLKVNVSRGTARDHVPSTVEGVDVRVDVVGQVRAQG